ncbi:MAG TPA: DUF2252 family protein [Candidatus Acidoferrales bacterium]|nr:DUF2252 family protein [Candidatus Acidoferrales bacterium]
MVKITKATRKFERWLGRRTPLIKSALDLKHKMMTEDPFTFLRATFYRWAQTWPIVCSDIASAPTVLAVGDLHVENFGTWRDYEGRLVWGINDFDEAHRIPYTNDLVRLAVSANLAIKARHLKMSVDKACKAILDGYTTGLKGQGKPFVLEEEHEWLRTAAMSDLRNPVHFWAKMDRLSPAHNVPKSALKALNSLLPELDDFDLAHRIAGVGSLGCERFVAIGEWQGGRLAREAKALAPSSWIWANAPKDSEKILYEEILETAFRAVDPFVRVRGRWLVRRLGPYCSRIELTELAKETDEKRLLEAMGSETANVHLGSKPAVKAVRRDLSKRRSGWLHAATKSMTEKTLEDYEEWSK